MYRKVDESARMSYNEASAKYRDGYVIMRLEGMNSEMGTVLYAGDTEKEMISLVMSLDIPYCVVLTGLNHQNSLWGVPSIIR